MDPKDRTLIIAQIEKSTEKLNAAKVLLKDGFVDDAISRAYYSMFHAASAVLLSAGISVESHSALKNMFGLHFVKTGKIDKKFSRWLNKLKDERENGDYDIFTSFDSEDARIDIQEAEEFLEEMKKYLTLTQGVEFQKSIP
ncbi:MAG: HEPN domain-containing protein [Desulfobacterales bacterium]|nr:HEPN domain-containing protein [Desulfobacterales bacterium]